MPAHRVVVDVQTTQSLLFGERGIPRYTADLCRALVRAGGPVAAFALNPSLPWPRHMHPELARSPLLAWNTSRLFQRLDDDGAGPLAYHVMSPFEGPRPVQTALPSYVFRHGLPLVCTVYDLIPEIFDVFPKATTYGRVYRLRRDMLCRADLLLAISKSTRLDAIHWLGVDPDRVVDIGTGASEYFRPPAEGDRPAALLATHVPELRRPFVMAITGVFGLDTRKNTEVLMDAYAQLPAAVRREHQLAVTCRITEADREVWRRRGRSLGLADDELVVTGYLPDAALRAMYQRAALFVYPSRYEGFGLPALEAVRCGCPTITSNTSAMPEILDWEPATFGPDDTDGLADLMERALTDESLRAKLLDVGEAAAARHTWDRVAARTIEAYGRLDTKPRARRRSRTLQIAIVGPLPPARSDVAVFNAALAERLVESCRVDMVAEPLPADHGHGHGGDPHADQQAERRARAGRRGHGYGVFPAASFGRVVSPAAYDAIFYAIANGPHHQETWSLAFKWPGIAWLHDLELAGLHLDYARYLGDTARDFMRNAVRHQYKERAPEQLFDDDDDLWQSPDAYAQFGARMAAEIASRSRGMVVGSALARSSLDLDAGPYARMPPTWLVPPASVLAPAPPIAAAAAAGGTDPLVLSLGPVHRARAEVVLEAAAVVEQSTPLRLAFVGDVDDADRRHLATQARTLGMEGRVDVDGWLAPARYAARMAEATAAVLLRPDISGAPPLALADALAAGVPTVTSSSAAAELPPGSVVVVPPYVTAADLVVELRRMLSDPEHRCRVASAARAHAASWTMDDVAAAVLEVVRADAHR